MNPSANTVMNPYANALCILKVNVTCDECKMKLMSVLSSICGVYSVDVDAEKGIAEIEGQVDPNLLLRELSRSGQHAELVRIKLKHPALGQRSSSSSPYYNSNHGYCHNDQNNYAIQDGYGRRMSLSDQPYYANGDIRYNNNVNYALPETSNYINSRYGTDEYAYSSVPRYVPSATPREYNPYEDEPWNCAIM